MGDPWYSRNPLQRVFISNYGQQFWFIYENIHCLPDYFHPSGTFHLLLFPQGLIPIQVKEDDYHSRDQSQVLVHPPFLQDSLWDVPFIGLSLTNKNYQYLSISLYHCLYAPYVNLTLEILQLIFQAKCYVYMVMIHCFLLVDLHTPFPVKINLECFVISTIIKVKQMQLFIQQSSLCIQYLQISFKPCQFCISDIHDPLQRV